MRVIVLLALLLAVAFSFADVCPHDMETACVDEVNKGTLY